jgi:HEXXH motif-containing protein
MSDIHGYRRSWQTLHQEAVHELVASFEHLQESHPALTSLVQIRESARRVLQSHAAIDGLSPWVFLLYGRLVTALINEEASDCIGEIADLLIHHLEQCDPSTCRLMPFASCEVEDRTWQFLIDNLQEEPSFPSDLQTPNPESLLMQEAMFRRAHTILHANAPLIADMLTQMQRLVILGRPGPASHLRGINFGGATTFFFWRGTVLNADMVTGLPSLIEQLVHEGCHAALFALSKDSHLCFNADNETHQVAIRPDPRPMHGIIHSYYVATNVAACLSRIAAASSTVELTQAEKRECLQRAEHNRLNAASSLDAIQCHGRLTELGRAIVADPLVDFL